jgi:cobyric acid synthase
MGATAFRREVEPFAVLDDGTHEGMRTGRIIGTYCHGAFENEAVLEEMLGIRVAENREQNKEAQYDRLAEWFAEHVDHSVLKEVI